jgi:hypothetical protein
MKQKGAFYEKRYKNFISFDGGAPSLACLWVKKNTKSTKQTVWCF